MNLGTYKPSKKSGNEHFHVNGDSINQDLLSFWQWSSSEILGNALRGVLAEYIVSLDIGHRTELREEWDDYDLETPDGIKIEVKSSSYLQSWDQENFSKISFGIQATYGWDYNTDSHSEILKRQADVYVFCLLAHQDKSTVDPMNLGQWQFFVVPTHVLNEQLGRQKTLSLPSLLSLEPLECQFGEIHQTIKKALSTEPV